LWEPAPIVPIFFSLIGIEFNIQSLVNAIPLFIALLAVAIATKITAGYAGAKLVGFTKDTSLAVGFLMNGRGMVDLVIATIGFAAGILDLTLFSIAVAIGFVTSLLALITSRLFVGSAKSKGSDAVAVVEESRNDQNTRFT
jgi:Kef-type K+ transport system membrane component KefB